MDFVLPLIRDFCMKNTKRLKVGNECSIPMNELIMIINIKRYVAVTTPFFFLYKRKSSHHNDTTTCRSANIST